MPLLSLLLALVGPALLLALALIVFAATLWPVFSSLWSASPVGLDAGFYNRVCLPLAALLVLLLALCPWLSWSFGFRTRLAPALLVLAGALFACGAYYLSYQRPLAMLAQLAAVAAALGSLLLLVRRGRSGLGAGSLGAHLGLALCALGVAFSGPYRTSSDLALQVGQSAKVAGYSVLLSASETGRALDHDYLRATLELRDGEGRLVATLRPEKRAYDKFKGMYFSEVDVSGGLGRELYASVSGLDAKGATAVQINVEPMVNWLWLGGLVMCLLPLLNLRRPRERAC